MKILSVLICCFVALFQADVQANACDKAKKPYKKYEYFPDHVLEPGLNALMNVCPLTDKVVGQLCSRCDFEGSCQRTKKEYCKTVSQAYMQAADAKKKKKRQKRLCFRERQGGYVALPLSKMRALTLFLLNVRTRYCLHVPV